MMVAERPDTDKFSEESTSSTSLNRFTLALVFSSMFLGAVGNKLLDGTVKLYDINRNAYWYSTSNHGGVIADGFLLLATLCAAIEFMRGRDRKAAPTSASRVIGLLVGWWIISSILRGEDSAKSITNIVCVAVLIFGIKARGVKIGDLAPLPYLYIALMATCLLYSFTQPATGSFACRADKCGIFGTLFTGVFPQENTLAIVASIFLPCVAIFRRRSLALLGAGLGVTAILATGSRASEAFLVINLALTCWLFRRLKGHQPKPVDSRVIWFFPLMLTVSTGVFLLTKIGELSDRGLAYLIVRQQASGVYKLIGPGVGSLQRAFAAGVTSNYEFTNEHSQAGQLVDRSGYVGLLLFVAFCFAVCRRMAGNQANIPGIVMAAFACAASLEFVTEVVWPFDCKSTGLASFLIVVGAAAVRDRDSDHASPDAERVDAPKLAHAQ